MKVEIIQYPLWDVCMNLCKTMHFFIFEEKKRSHGNRRTKRAKSKQDLVCEVLGILRFWDCGNDHCQRRRKKKVTLDELQEGLAWREREVNGWGRTDKDGYRQQSCRTAQSQTSSLKEKKLPAHAWHWPWGTKVCHWDDLQLPTRSVQQEILHLMTTSLQPNN